MPRKPNPRKVLFQKAFGILLLLTFVGSLVGIGLVLNGNGPSHPQMLMALVWGAIGTGMGGLGAILWAEE